MSNRPRRGALFARSRRGSHFAYILLEFALQKVAPRVTTSLVGTWTAAKMPEKEKSERRLFLRPSQARAWAPHGGAWRAQNGQGWPLQGTLQDGLDGVKARGS